MNSLSFSNEKCFEILKQYEESKVKVYVCLVICSKPVSEADLTKINSFSDLLVKFRTPQILYFIKIKQKTPLRVLHRRTLLVRDKIIHRMQAFKLNEKFMVFFAF